MTSSLTFCLLGESILPDEVNPQLNRQWKHIRPLTATMKWCMLDQSWSCI